MGLDMYAFGIMTKPDSPVDFQPPENEEAKEIAYWRKHPNLHGWMFALYRAKGGEKDAKGFNCVNLVIDSNDLDKLEKTIDDNALPPTTGFFFGESTPDRITQDRDFIKAARQAIADGMTVYYTSWW